MDPLTVCLTILGLIIATIASIYQILSYNKMNENMDKGSTIEPGQQNLQNKLLLYFWNYPTAGIIESSLAVKESAVFRGDLIYAREKPGLGSAIISTELALKYFGNLSESRIDGCISWALSNTQNNYPRFIIAEFIDPITSLMIKKPDFRHTLAFAIILARTGKLFPLLKEYLQVVLETQRDDGGWAPGEGVTISELFTVLYGLELLHLCSQNDNLSAIEIRHCINSRDRAALWFINNSTDDGLWVSGVMKEYSWDDIVSTAWVLHRIANINISISGWDECIVSAAHTMITRARLQEQWIHTPDIQRFRVESRIAAATVKILKLNFLPYDIEEHLNLYLNNWKRKTASFLRGLPDSELDLSTVLFCLEGLFLEGLFHDTEIVEAALSITSPNKELL